MLCKIVLASFIILLINLFTCAAGEETKHLEIKNISQNKSIAKIRIKVNDFFYYKYTHSVQKLPIREKFQVGGNDKLILVETRLKSLAALGDVPAEDQRALVLDDHILIFSNRTYDNIMMRTTYYYDQVFETSDQKIILNHVADSGDEIKIEIINYTRETFKP